MKFLLALLDALVGFVQRNPLTVLVVLILALAAPAVLKGIAVFILYFVLGIIALSVIALFVFRWKINSMRKQMEEQFGDQNPGGSPFGNRQEPSHEGDVKVHTTSETPEKRVSKSVGDYVDFEEEKE